MKFFTRASFWKTIIQAFQVGLSTIQGVTLYSEDMVKDFNIWIAVAQGVLAMISILTKDENMDDIIDIVESRSKVDVTVSSPDNVDVTVTKEKKEPS